MKSSGHRVMPQEVYSPAGFEQAFKDRLLRPNRTAPEAEESRKKHGIVYRDPQQ